MFQIMILPTVVRQGQSYCPEYVTQENLGTIYPNSLDEVTRNILKVRHEQLEAELKYDGDRMYFWCENVSLRDVSRPLAEPPILNYEVYERLTMRSDLKFKLLFDEILKRKRYADLHAEGRLLVKYPSQDQATVPRLRRRRGWPQTLHGPGDGA